MDVADDIKRNFNQLRHFLILNGYTVYGATGVRKLIAEKT